MKKIFLLGLVTLLVGCSQPAEQVKILPPLDLPTKSDFEIVEVLDVECALDANCETPFEYAIRSNCPYSAKCLDSKCTVICPRPFEGVKNPASDSPIIENDVLPPIALPENVISVEECTARGGEIFNTLGVESFEGVLIGKIEGLWYPCACLVK